MLRLWRTTFGVVLLAGLAFALATVEIGVLAYDITHEALEQQLDHRTAVETRSLLDEERTDGFAALVEAVRGRSTARSTASLDYVLLDARGRVRATTIEPLTRPAPGYEEFFHFRRDGEERIGQALTTRFASGTLVVIADRADLDSIDWMLAALFASALAAMLALGVGAAAFVGLTTQRRLARIDAAALAIIDGTFDHRIDRDYSGSEFDQLAATLNRMLDRIGALMDNLRQVSSDVAHDLRTPLTRLSNQLERALDQTGAAERTAAIVGARDQADELLAIFAALLRIAEVEGMADRHAEPVDVTALVGDMAETYRPDMEASDHRLLVRVDPGLAVAGDRRLIAQGLANLLDNAIRHTPAGTLVRVSAHAEPGRVVIAVEDDGPGIVGENAARIFERFARSEKSRSTPGHGLGLALVRAVAMSHGGSVAVTRKQDGFGVAITLPA